MSKRRANLEQEIDNTGSGSFRELKKNEQNK